MESKCENLKTILDSDCDEELGYINEMLETFFVKRLLIRFFLAKYNSSLFDNILTIVNATYTKSSSKCVIKIKNSIKKYINEANDTRKCVKSKEYVNDIYNNIINSNNNKIKQSKYINTFFDYLLGEDWLNLEYILKYSTEEILKLIAKVLILPEVQKYLPIIRINFLNLKVQECSIKQCRSNQL